MYDVVIVGGGPAGLSAALVLGRCRRRVFLVDDGRPRNAPAQALHGYLTRDGIPPLQLRELGRDELAQYDVGLGQGTVVGIDRRDDGFDVRLQSGDTVQARMVLVATGVRDELPRVPGLSDCYGTSVHHCPYCDGWEVRDRALAALGEGAAVVGLALSLKTWSSRVIACVQGSRLRAAHRRQLADHDIELHAGRIERVEHEDGRVRQLVFADGSTAACDAIFFAAPQQQRSTLAAQLGCEFTSRGTVKTDLLGRTCVDGIYVVGDASRDVQFVIVAAAEGAKAAVAINKALQERAGQKLVT